MDDWHLVRAASVLCRIGSSENLLDLEDILTHLPHTRGAVSNPS